MGDVSRNDRELIREYREYDESKDPGRHKYSEMYKELARRAGSPKISDIEGWISEQENKLNPGFLNLPKPISEEPRGREYLEQVIAETTDAEKRVFFKKLLAMLKDR